jgi:hypothetical protein
MAAIPGTTPVTAPVAPTSDGDVYPSHLAAYGKGGLRTVATLTDRNNIPNARKEAGMQVYVIETHLTYKLSEDLAEWATVTEGSSGGSVSTLDGRYIQHNEAQGLTASQQLQARSNLEVFGKTEAEDWGFLPSAAAPTAPEMPINFTASLMAGKIKLVWTHSGANVTSFEVRRSRDAGAVAAQATLETDARAYEQSPGLGEYDYYVAAIGAGGTTVTSAVHVSIAGTAPAAATALSNLVAPVGGGSTQKSIHLFWTHPGTNVLGFRINRDPDSSYANSLPVGEVAATAREFWDYQEPGFSVYWVVAINSVAETPSGSMLVDHN